SKGGWDDAAQAVAIRDDKIIVAGFTYGYGTNRDFAAIQLNYSDGTLDTNFAKDTGGIFHFDVSAGAWDDGAQAIIIQTGGTIVLGGWTYGYQTNRDFAAIRLSKDGVRDAQFAGGASKGVFHFDVSKNGYDDFAQAMAQTSKGELVFAGATY